jgi:Uma2 family endonuclease
MQSSARRTYTYTDYEKLPEGPAWQLIDGDLVMTPAPTPFHQEVLLRMCTALREHALHRKLGLVFLAPIDVYLSDTETYQPDIIFISQARRSIVGEKKIEGAPDVVVEILSPGSGYYDLVHKKTTYRTSGVKEYWIIDPLEKTVEVFENTGDEFRRICSTRERGPAASGILRGFSIEAEALFAPIGT